MRKTIKRLGAVLLAMAMAVSVLCTGALAADTSNSITITNTSSGHIYEAYQVFAGSTGATIANKTSLGITGWGSGVKANDLVTALTTESGTAGSILNGKFANILKKGNTENGDEITDKTSADAAQNVAASIKGFDDNEAKAFAKIVAAHLSETKTDFTETEDATNSATTGYKAENLAAGYYLVKDKDDSITTDKEDAYTNYIMEVVGAVTVTPKSAVPKVNKKIVEDNTGKPATTAKVGDVVNFELTGTLPDNYADYTKYQYEFHDTLSKGLTYNGDVKVYVKNGEAETELASDSYTVTPAKNTATTTPTDATTITVTFADLKTAKGENVTIDKDSKIIVKYSATLNENAIVGGEGNTNTVKLMYSNDPNGTSTGTTKDDKATVYTFQLNVTKVDGADNTKKLAGAKFKLYYETTENETTEKHYAVVNTTAEENKDKITGWTTTETEGTVLTTDNDGNITVKGLKEGTYYLEETEAPAGYNKLTAPVKVEITKNSTNIHELDSVTADNKSGTIDTNNKAIGTITIANNKGSTLPSTGGMGTKLFYTIGGILMAGAAIVLVVRKRRSDAE